jgi:uncharacterized membrane protein
MALKHAKSTSPALLSLERLLFLTDGVFAITLTLLVLDLKLEPDRAGNLAQALVDLIPRLAAYFFAFATIANQWILHHRSFRLVQHANNRLVMYTFVYLLFVTLIPATTAIVGGAPTDPIAAASFSTNTLLLCLSAWAIWRYLGNANQLLASDAEHQLLQKIARVWRYVTVGFAISIAAGFISVTIAYSIWHLWPLTARWIR